VLESVFARTQSVEKKKVRSDKGVFLYTT
jgi:hypothetical protein